MSAKDPIRRFAELYKKAQLTISKDPNAVVLATADRRGRPAARVVLLKAFDERGFVFYTNLESRKGRELADNPHAALCFYWPQLDRQVRIEGPVQPVSTEEADAYFASRPRLSQLGAWASKQSQPMSDRTELLRRVATQTATHLGKSVPRPPHWSGYRLVPASIEFWHARLNRLHTRWLYERSPRGDWTSTLLFP